MRLTFKTSELQSRLQQLAAVVAKKATLPVYSNVELFASAGDVYLRGFDVGATLTVKLTGAKSEGDIDLLLPFGKLSELVSGITAEETTITVNDGGTEAVIKAAKLRAVIRPFAGDTPTLMDEPETIIAEIGLPGFQEQIDNVDFIVPDGSGKYQVSVAQLSSDGTALKLVGTDGHGLAISTAAMDAGSFSFNLPRTALELVKRLVGGAGSNTVKIATVDAGFYFYTETETLTVSTTAGEFPKYGGILPENGKPPKAYTEVVFADAGALDEFKAAVKRVKPLADKEAPVITFAVGTDAVAIEAASSEAASEGSSDIFKNVASDEAPATVTGPTVKFALDVKVLSPFLEKAKAPLSLRVIDGKNVIDFQSGDGGYRFLQMPRSL
jgi:DNA polymerase III sliding clamp (beta) subunit (PCNA family)